MSFTYKNPISGVEILSPNSVSSSAAYGSNFSVLGVGGYMEVWNVSDLGYSTFGATGNINNSGNTIPVVFYKRPAPTITDRITLNSDGISSGRRRIGMLVYVYETNTTYQYQIDNYDTLWNNAVANNCITTATTSYTVSNRVGGVAQASGQALIEAWTGSTVEGQGGVSRENASWRIYYGSDVQITGGTYDSDTSTLDLNNSTGGTVSITGFTSGGGSSTEYLSINSVPSSYGILAWDASQPFRDTYVTIPEDFNGRTITSVTASYGDSASTTNAVFVLQMKNSSGSVAGSVSWTHTGGSRSHQETFGSALTLASGNTLNLFYSSTPPDSNAKGYSATFEISN
jgi:hypothetical protein